MSFCSAFESPSNRTPSPPDLNRRKTTCPSKEEEGENATTEVEMMGMSSLSARGQLGSRPHTPVGRVDIRPHDDPAVVPQTLYYAPVSPKLEFKSAPTTPVTERWQSLSKVRIYNLYLEVIVWNYHKIKQKKYIFL